MKEKHVPVTFEGVKVGTAKINSDGAIDMVLNIESPAISALFDEDPFSLRPMSFGMIHPSKESAT